MLAAGLSVWAYLQPEFWWVGLLGVLVLVLAATGVLLRRKEKEPEENSNTDSADTP